MEIRARDQIATFIDLFVARERQGGWVSALISKPSKAKKQLVKFEKHLNRKNCFLVDDPLALIESLPDQDCLYWDGEEEPKFIKTGNVFGQFSSRDMVRPGLIGG